MNNPILLKTVSAVAFIISAIFTILLMTSGTVGILAYVLTVGMALVLEACKCGFMYEALANDRLNAIVRFTMGVIALLLVGSSILASASYVQNQANKVKNIDIVDSLQFKELKQGKVVQEDLYNATKKGIEDLKALQQQQQQKGEEIANSMPSDYITRKSNQRAATQNQVAETQKMINTKQSELSSLGANLQSPIDTTSLKINSSDGYTAMFQQISELLNGTEGFKNKPVKAEALEMWFFISLGIIFELTAILTAYLAQTKGSYSGAATKKEFIKDTGIGFKKPQLVTATHEHDNAITSKGDSPVDEKPSRIIGFYQEPMTASTTNDKNNGMVKSPVHYETTNVQAHHPISQGDIKIYLDYMYKTEKNNISTGYMSISKHTGLTVEACRKIKGHLERLNIIETVGAKTVILQDNNNAERLVSPNL